MLAVSRPQPGAVRHRTGGDQGIRQFHLQLKPKTARDPPCRGRP
jgi:hypothetical protein